MTRKTGSRVKGEAVLVFFSISSSTTTLFPPYAVHSRGDRPWCHTEPRACMIRQRKVSRVEWLTAFDRSCVHECIDVVFLFLRYPGREIQCIQSDTHSAPGIHYESAKRKSTILRSTSSRQQSLSILRFLGRHRPARCQSPIDQGFRGSNNTTGRHESHAGICGQ